MYIAFACLENAIGYPSLGCCIWIALNPLEEVFDPTGAGDTFAGGFIGAIAASDDTSFESMKRAIIQGSALASFTCEKFGTERLVELTREELAERLEEFVKLTRFESEVLV